MTNRTAIVERVAHVQQVLGTIGVSETAIHFENGDVARIHMADQRAVSHLKLIEDAQRMSVPIYVETDPQSLVARVLIPIVVHVSAIQPLKTGDVRIELKISHAQHFLRRSNAEFAALLSSLQTAQKQKTLIAVTEDDSHEIIDVRTWTAKAPPLGAAGPAALSLETPALSAITLQEATEFFTLVAGQSCDPLTVPGTCIPFLYPDDGCWGRASQMCRLIEGAGKQPGKIWNYGDLQVSTVNNPTCAVSWGWHVAPIVQVSGQSELYVLDPSLFSSPCPVSQWKEVQSDPQSTLAETAATVFYRSQTGEMEEDPGYVQTATVLSTYRLKLKVRSLSSVGPPPYENCIVNR